LKIKSLSDIDLSRPFFDENHIHINRPWEEEIIYFLMIDRFHDGLERPVDNYNSENSINQERLVKRIGGTFSGIQSQLSYIKNLGCTTIWLSPVFENYENSYHGYAICNFLTTDPRFGTLEELKLLVKEAHQTGIRIVLDVVINHTADTWFYKDENPSYTGSTFNFGGWKDEEYPLPQELRNQSYYKKAGVIRNWDSYPETQEGDIFELKKLITDESPIGKEVLTSLIKIYSYWMKETDIDGFRLDTVKHLTPSAVAIFCTGIKEYARYLGKNSFMIFGEAVGGDALMGRYLKAVSTSSGYKRGLDAALDFPLHFILEEVIKGKRLVGDLYKVYRSKQKLLAKLNKRWSDMIVFADNHDQIGQEHKTRIAHESDGKEVLALVGFLYFLYGIPCLYYGTEQFLQGNGKHDCWLREPMFDKEKNKCFQNQESFLFKGISNLAVLRRTLAIFAEAEMEIDSVSVNNGEFISCEYTNEVIYWSKRIFEEKMIVVYNPKKDEKASISAKLSTNGHRIKSKFEYVYGGIGEVNTLIKEECGYINIDLNPQQFVILK
jgi:glycosidase